MYPVITIADDARDSLEQLGTKEKFWLRIDDQRHLFKMGRPGTGENWAEKIAAELADLLGLPHASYELAVWKGRNGVLSPRFVPDDGRLVLGNELLAAIHTGYPQREIRQVRDHTLGRIHALLIKREIGHPPDWAKPDKRIVTAYDLFLGYLLLDAWIANQDRHHENWGLISHQQRICLAPSYDHAASMGQNETDPNRQNRLTTQDRGHHISRYVTRARSAIYDSKTSKKPLLTVDLFQKATAKSPHAATFWLDKLRNIPQNAIENRFDKLPENEITPLGRQFALTMLNLNRQRLLEDHTPCP